MTPIALKLRGMITFLTASVPNHGVNRLGAARTDAGEAGTEASQSLRMRAARTDAGRASGRDKPPTAVAATMLNRAARRGPSRARRRTPLAQLVRAADF